jgi:hypothetical protein
VNGHHAAGLPDSITDDRIDQLVEVLAEYGVTIGTSARGLLEVSLTVLSTNLELATMSALALVRTAAWPDAELVASQVRVTVLAAIPNANGTS